MYDAGRKRCLELLEGGFVNAFEETLRLVDWNQEISRRAELGQDRERPKDLSKDLEVTKTVMEMLKKSEKSDRKGNIEATYAARIELANKFIEVDGFRWLAEHLYKSCYRILEKDGRLKIKTLQLLGRLEERRNNPEAALRYKQKAILMADKASFTP
ncbi:hypothetical protein CEXT_53681 [Caerostris extrusa]|uniref:Uncharacterized protein n=1 Tax=Caerostris extrusa TaxID=172846 RepID=A0AAV4X8P0_CAEEX|nr:hypothetical protein CEXT_53681 [Caerostris extrusa]